MAAWMARIATTARDDRECGRADRRGLFPRRDDQIADAVIAGHRCGTGKPEEHTFAAIASLAVLRSVRHH